MVKQIGTFLILLLLPVILFALVYFGMTLFAPTIEPTAAPTEQHMLSPKEPTATCGNGICEKIERDETSCAEDC